MATGLFGPPGLVAQLPLMLYYERGQEFAQIQSLTDVVTTVLEIRARTPCVQLTSCTPRSKCLRIPKQLNAKVTHDHVCFPLF